MMRKVGLMAFIACVGSWAVAAPATTWKEVWREEFKGNKLDETNWSFVGREYAAKPYPTDYKEMNCWAHITEDPIAYKFTGETLKLLCVKNPDLKKDPRPFLCGGIQSKGKRTFKYGKVEVRFRLKGAKGTWPAIWMMPSQAHPKGFYGEMDLLERLNYDPYFYQTTHTTHSLTLKKRQPPNSTRAPFDTNGWNTVGVEWHPDRLVYTANGKPTYVWPKLVPEPEGQWTFDRPFFLYIDMQLGGAWVGPIGPETLNEPAEMEIDWVSYSVPVENPPAQAKTPAPVGLQPPLVGRGWVNGWVQGWEPPPSDLEVRDAYEPIAPGFTRVTRRWTWHGKTPLEQVTLAARVHVSGEQLKPFIPGVLMYGNPSNAGRTDGRVPVYAGKPGEFAIFEDHRLPMPFVLLEDARARNFTAVHTVPSPVRGAKREDLWWSAGVEKADDEGADIVLLSGPVGYNRCHSTVKALQRGSMAYDETYITLMPGQVVEKIFYIQHGTATDASFGFQQALAKTLDLYPPANMPLYAERKTIAKAKRDYALTRWIDQNGMCGFNMYGSQQRYRSFTMGWCGCAATCGWALPVLNFDPADLVKAQKSLDFLADTMGPLVRPDGLYPVTFNPDTKKTGGGDPVSCGQALLSFMRAIRHAAKDKRLNATKWRAFADKAAGAMAAVVLKPDWKTPRSTAIGFYVAPLVLAAETFQKPAYRAAAEKIATTLAQTYIGYDRVYWGGTLDASCEDKEGAYAAFQGFAALLFDAVRRGDKAAEALWAPRARHAMDLMLTYTMVWDTTYPPGRLSDHAFKSTGWTVVSAQNQHLDAFGVLATPEIARMGRYLKEPRLERLAQVMFASCFQLTSPDGSLGEQIQHTNFAQQGAMNDVRKLRGGYSEHWVVFWLTAHFLNAAASFESPDDSL